MKATLLLFTVLFTSFSYAQDTDLYDIRVVVIRDKLYKMHHGLHKSNDAITNTSIKYTEVDLSNILFKTTKAELLPQSYDELNALFILLKENSNMNLKIEGHTDNIGNSKSNLKLSIRRARAIKLYLVKKGIKFNRITTVGHGDISPICDAPCIKNQRVEFSLIENGKENRLAHRWIIELSDLKNPKKN